MNTSNDILHAYLQVSRHVSEKFRIYYGKLNLTYPQSIVLAILETDGPMPISALAEAAGSANSTISGVVDRLEKMDLVQRVRSTPTVRVIYVSTTDALPVPFCKIQGDCLRPVLRRPELPLPRGSQHCGAGLMLLNQALESEDD